jgi:hypothetical protein
VNNIYESLCVKIGRALEILGQATTTFVFTAGIFYILVHQIVEKFEVQTGRF